MPAKTRRWETNGTRTDAYLLSILICGASFMAALFAFFVVAVIIKIGFGWQAVAATSVVTMVASVAEIIYAQPRVPDGR